MGTDLAGKTVLVTGASSGIGREIALRFAVAGSRLALTYFAHRKEAEEVAELCRGLGSPEVLTVSLQLADEDSLRTLVETVVDRFGAVDILVNNAGVAGPDANTEDIDFDSWSRTLNVNLSGTFLCSQHAIRLLKQGGTGGSIVNISSNVGLMGLARRAPYVASKWALIGLTRTLSLELGPFGIRVNAICPGDVEGERIARVILMEAESRGVSRDQVIAERVEGTALRTFISPHDVAALVLFVCSDAGARISGQSLAVDGHVEHL